MDVERSIAALLEVIPGLSRQRAQALLDEAGSLDDAIILGLSSGAAASAFAGMLGKQPWGSTRSMQLRHAKVPQASCTKMHCALLHAVMQMLLRTRLLNCAAWA